MKLSELAADLKKKWQKQEAEAITNQAIDLLTIVLITFIRTLIGVVSLSKVVSTYGRHWSNTTVPLKW